MHGFHRTGCANRHEKRGFNGSMVSGKLAGTGRCTCVAVRNFEMQIAGVLKIPAKVRVLLVNIAAILLSKEVFF
jgi:hypothetical protein